MEDADPFTTESLLRWNALLDEPDAPERGVPHLETSIGGLINADPAR
jgi:hypothetical protein